MNTISTLRSEKKRFQSHGFGSKHCRRWSSMKIHTLHGLKALWVKTQSKSMWRLSLLAVDVLITLFSMGLASFSMRPLQTSAANLSKSQIWKEQAPTWNQTTLTYLSIGNLTRKTWSSPALGKIQKAGKSSNLSRTHLITSKSSSF